MTSDSRPTWYSTSSRAECVKVVSLQPRQGCPPSSVKTEAQSPSPARTSAPCWTNLESFSNGSLMAIRERAPPRSRRASSPCTRNALQPNGWRMAWSSATNSFSFWRSAAICRRGPATSGVRVGGSSRQRPSSATTCFLLALWLCSSRQKSPSPHRSSRRFTTSSAAVFSLTNSTVFPAASASAIMFAMVWLLPVPGGPSITRCAPRFTASIASCWLLSASRM